MRIHLIQHLPTDDSVTLAEWCGERGHELGRTHLPEEGPPDADAIDMLVVHGGLMSAYDEANHPWLADEKAFLKAFAETGKPLLGLCLGAQLLADALGGKARPHVVREIGWHEVRLTDEGRACGLLDLPDRFAALQWHADNFDLPPGAKRLAESDACENQAFLWKENVIACQFHVEYSSTNIEELLDATRDSLGQGPYVHPPERIVPCEENAQGIRALYRRLLDAMASIL